MIIGITSNQYNLNKRIANEVAVNFSNTGKRVLLIFIANDSIDFHSISHETITKVSEQKVTVVHTLSPLDEYTRAHSIVDGSVIKLFDITPNHNHGACDHGISNATKQYLSKLALKDNEVCILVFSNAITEMKSGLGVFISKLYIPSGEEKNWTDKLLQMSSMFGVKTYLFEKYTDIQI